MNAFKAYKNIYLTGLIICTIALIRIKLPVDDTEIGLE
jgi:hypothetical protein